MRCAFQWMCGCVALVVALAVSGMAIGPVLAAAGEGEMKAKDRAPMKGMLPLYYRDLVDKLQQDEIYKIQKSYKAQLDKLDEQVKELEAKRDAEIEATLRPDQKEKLAKLRQEKAVADKAKADEAKAKADAKAEARKKAAAESASEKPKKADAPKKADTAKTEKPKS